MPCVMPSTCRHTFRPVTSTVLVRKWLTRSRTKKRRRRVAETQVAPFHEIRRVSRQEKALAEERKKEARPPGLARLASPRRL